MQRDFTAAERVIDRALALDPKSFSLWSLKAQIAVTSRGDFSAAEKGFAVLDEARRRGGGDAAALKDPEVKAKITEARANVALLQRKYREVLEEVNQLPKEKLESKPHGYVGARIYEGIAREKLGQITEARAAFTEARKSSEEAVQEAPNEPARHAGLAQVLAHLGEKDAAIAEARRAVELRPESVDAFEGPGITETLGAVYALTGENAKAIELIDGLLSRPGNLTVTLLKLDPVWDGLRNDPAFQQVLAKH
jgi:tetratricopeptide (TPR) repeat protein